MVKLAELWERTSARGTRYFSGFMGDTQVLMFDGGEQPHPTKPGETVHVWRLMVQERDPARRPQAKSAKWLIPLAPAVLQVVPEHVGGGWDGRAAAIATRVRGAVPRRGGVRPLAAREALAGRVPLPGLRPRPGLGAEPRAADAPVRGLRAAGLGHRRHGAARQPPGLAHLVPGRVADGDAQERHLRPAAVVPARARLLQVGLAAGAQAAPGDGRPGPGAARRPGRGGRDQPALSRRGRAGPARAVARR